MVMNLTEPKIEVITDKPVQTREPDGMAGSVCVIADLGELESYDLIIGEDYRKLQNNMPSDVDVTKTDYKAIEKLFNQTRQSTGSTFTIICPLEYKNSAVTYESFSEALDKVENENFDILNIPSPIKYDYQLFTNNTKVEKSNIILGEFISASSFKNTSGEEVTGETGKYYCDYKTGKCYEYKTSSFVELIDCIYNYDAYLLLIKSWLNARYKSKAGVGVTFSLNDTVDNSGFKPPVEERMRVFENQRGVYSVITQEVNGYDLASTSCFLTGVIAGIKLNQSLTHKIIQGIYTLDKDLKFSGINDTGTKYMNTGVTVLRAFDRRNSQFGVLRSTCPSGYDLAIERSADYMTREFQLSRFLGESSSTITLDAIAGEINTKIYQFTEILNLCNSIEANIIKIDYHTIEVDLKYVFDGIIDYIKIYINIEELNE